MIYAIENTARHGMLRARIGKASAAEVRRVNDAAEERFGTINVEAFYSTTATLAGFYFPEHRRWEVRAWLSDMGREVRV